MTAPATARSAWLHAGVLAVAALLLPAVPAGPWRAGGEVLVFALGLRAVPVALRRHRAPAVLVWWGLAGGLLCFGASSAAEVLQLSGVAAGVTGGLELGFDLAAYACVVVAAVGQLAVGRRRRDREAWIDTASLLLAAALTMLAFSGGTGAIIDGFAGRTLGVALVTAVVLLVCVPLAVTESRPSVCAGALLVAGAITVLSFSAQIAAGPGAPALLEELPLLAVAAVVLAGRHPSVVTLGRPSSSERGTTSRVAGLGAALLVSPALLLLWGVRHGGTGYVLGLGSALLTGLALYRLTCLNQARERAGQALATSEARLRLLLENAADVIAIVDADGTVAYMSPAVQTLLGRPAAEYVGRDAIELADPRDQPRLRALVAAAGEAASGGVADTDIRVQHSSGGARWVEMRISGRVEDAGISGWVVNLREVTDRKLFEDELRRQASTDPLTGLLNRTAFNDRLAAAADDAGTGSPPAVLFVDVDDFKSINDTLGHAAGDELLVTVAARLSADVRADDVVARLGGDEFAVLLSAADAERMREVADRLLVSLRAPLELAGTTVSITASIGGALGAPGDTADRLLHRADTAMYAAKRNGKDSRALVAAG